MTITRQPSLSHRCSFQHSREGNLINRLALGRYVYTVVTIVLAVISVQLPLLYKIGGLELKPPEAAVTAVWPSIIPLFLAQAGADFEGCLRYAHDRPLLRLCMAFAVTRPLPIHRRATDMRDVTGPLGMEEDCPQACTASAVYRAEWPKHGPASITDYTQALKEIAERNSRINRYACLLVAHQQRVRTYRHAGGMIFLGVFLGYMGCLIGLPWVVSLHSRLATFLVVLSQMLIGLFSFWDRELRESSGARRAHREPLQPDTNPGSLQWTTRTTIGGIPYTAKILVHATVHSDLLTELEKLDAGDGQHDEANGRIRCARYRYELWDHYKPYYEKGDASWLKGRLGLDPKRPDAAPRSLRLLSRGRRFLALMFRYSRLEWTIVLFQSFLYTAIAANRSSDIKIVIVALTALTVISSSTIYWIVLGPNQGEDVRLSAARIHDVAIHTKVLDFRHMFAEAIWELVVKYESESREAADKRIHKLEELSKRLEELKKTSLAINERAFADRVGVWMNSVRLAGAPPAEPGMQMEEAGNITV